MYHMISKTDHLHEKRYALSPEKFKRQMRYVKQKGYTPIGLDDLHGYFYKNNTLPSKPIVITFDDGYMDNYEKAFPILREHNFKATIFVVAGLVGKTNQWMKDRGYPERQLMGWDEIEECKKYGITIGSHTLNHPRLSLLKNKDARREIEDSKKLIEDRIRARVNHFAYPYGDMNESIVNMVEEAGYKTACSARSGFNSKNIYLTKLRRIEIYGTDSIWQFAIKLTYGTNKGDFLFPMKYYMKRLNDRIRVWTLV